jgi:GNAT superfamily N-acetyltransferase
VRIERDGKRILFGLGVERYLVAWLVRKGWLPRVKSACSSPRRAAGSALQAVQALTLYRTICRGLRKQFVVTEATAEDRKAVGKHLSPGSPTPPEEADRDATDYVARIGAKVVGFVQLVRYTEADAPWSGFWLFSLTVWPLYRRFGIGEALTRKIVEQARSNRVPDLFVAVYENNDRAIGLYRKLGFEFVTLPLLEPHLMREKHLCGQRRIVLRKAIRQPASA